VRDTDIQTLAIESKLPRAELEMPVYQRADDHWTSVSSEEAELDAAIRRLARPAQSVLGSSVVADAAEGPRGLIALFVAWLRRMRQALAESGQSALDGSGSDPAGSSTRSSAATSPPVGEIRRALATLEQALLEKAILPALRTALTDAIGELKSTVLPKREASGLGQLVDVSKLVPTESRYLLVRLALTLSTGCIGVGGPRGAGKSTLLGAMCDPAIPEGESPFDYRVLVSAPTKYDAREFLLYLTRRTCEVYLRSEFGLGTEELAREAELSSSAGRELAPTRRILFGAALAGGIAFAAWLVVSTLFGSLAGVGAALLACALVLGFAAAVDALNGWDALPLGLLSGPAGLCGIGCVALAVLHVDVDSRFVLAAVTLLGVFALPVLVVHLRSLARRPERIQSAGYGEIGGRAVELWRSTRYQLSYSRSTNASMSLSVSPMTVGGGMTRGVTEQPLPQSLPEVVDSFKNLVAYICQDRRTLIAIDELDKMGSLDATQDFLNDIKGVFGVPNCVFMLSVSADALASFQRRGLPARDVVDSSVDDVVRVEPLDYAAASELLSRQVLRVPMPFLALCFALSGGLARDLIRTARTLFAVDNRAREDRAFRVKTSLPEGGLPIGAASRWLVAADLVERARGTVTELNAIDDPKAAEAASAAGDWALRIASLSSLDDLQGASSLPWTRDDEVAEVVRGPVARLCALTYLDSTIREVFSDREYGEFDTAANTGLPRSFDRLASARQRLAVSPKAAWAELDSYRDAWGLSPWACPIPPWPPLGRASVAAGAGSSS
jgi:energy-coupling factor transporter ATP-binding protein EcfA2